MSQSSDNEIFAGEVQRYLKDGDHYHGHIDRWAGPLTLSAWRASLGEAPAPAPLIDIPQGIGPTPAPTYRLPAETNAAMTAFYGPASSSPSYLDWFSFPDPGTRLYDRGGELLKDRSGDARLDHKCHRLLIGRLTAALAEIYLTLGREEYRRQGWHVYGGAHNYREKRGGSTLSTHAWGIAIDMCPNENTLISSRTTFSPAAIDIMERWGFLSGGRAWNSDYMHFQAVIPHISAGSYYAKHGLPRNIVKS